MAVSRAEKEAEVQQLEVAFKSAEHAILVDYKGLNVLQATELRRQIRGAEAQYLVVKNSLAKRAVPGTVLEPLGAFFQGTTAVALSEDDPVALTKVLTSFAKKAPQLMVKVAVVQGRTVTASQVMDLAALPDRPVLVATFLRQLNTSMVQLVSVLGGLTRDLVNVLAQAEKIRSEEQSNG